MPDTRSARDTVPAIDLRSVCLMRAGRKILDDVSFQVACGSVCGLLGANGAGKTSVLRVATGLIGPHAGEVRVARHPVAAGRMPAQVGALIEEPRFYPWLSARENLLVAAAGRRERVVRIDDLLAEVGLWERKADKVRAYSQGMRQRLGIARVLLGSPEVLLLDEPANGLDPAGYRWLRGLVARLNANGVTILLASHALGEVQRLCSEVVVLAEGKVVACGTTAEVLSGHATLEDYFFALTDEEDNGVHPTARL